MMDQDSDRTSIGDSFDQEWACNFHGYADHCCPPHFECTVTHSSSCSVSYAVTVEVLGSVLRVVAEETQSNDRWRGEFSAQCKTP